MFSEIKRYKNPEIVDHLAANYVLGSLPIRVSCRVQNLVQSGQYEDLVQRIHYWENQMSPLNQSAPEIEPHAKTWSNIEAQLGFAVEQDSTIKTSLWSSLSFFKIATAFSFLAVLVISSYTFMQPAAVGNLSYVAVIADEQQKPQVVAATYGDSQTLLLDIIDLPEIQSDESFELWVTSKTDAQARSLGLIPIGENSFSRQLSLAEWRLIKDSDSLLISIEDAGGSPIGEPMGEIVSRGLCVRLSAWQENT